ncbi:MAG: VWA domain-containing protein, partial [Proteobacteria bacterium]|nr:VWA domain-containing protein [Pseudomonadota bacterium]
AYQESTSEGYVNYGVNDMTLSTKDALSTFSIDVDTASYTIARRKLLDGYLPPAASVRVEEFVNYFPYAYVQPVGDAPFAVNMEAAPNPFEPRHHVLRIGVQGDELSADERKPVRLTFLVDVSGSMSSADKLGLAKRSLHLLVDQLDAEDSVALGTYAGATRMVLTPTPATDKDAIHAAIESLSSGGGTAMSSGIDMAYDMAQRAYVPGAENRVVVLSDGDANIGPSSHQQILTQIQDHAKAGITLTTVGFGMGNYKDTMMEQLANDGDGNYFYIDGMNEARKVFSEDLSGTIQTIARDVKIQVEFDP